MEELREINHLDYKIPTCIDVVGNATITNYNFNPNQYDNCSGGEILQIEFDEGLDFVDGSNSYIRLVLKVNATNLAPAVSFYSFNGTNISATGYPLKLGDYMNNSGSSVMNLISQVELVTKSGETIFKELYKNQVQTLREYKINNSRKDFLTITGGQSSNVNSSGNQDNLNMYNINNQATFLIPLALISPFFNTGSLIPPQLLNGSILRLTLSPPINSIVLVDSTLTAINNVSPVTVNLSNMAVLLSEKELFPEIADVIDKRLSSPQGLDYSYYSEFNTYFIPPFESASVTPIFQSFQIPISLNAGKIKYVAMKNIPLANGSPIYPFINCAMAWSDFYYLQNPNLSETNKLPYTVKARLGNDVLLTYDLTTIPEAYEITTRTLNNISFSNTEDVDVEKNINKLAPCCVSGSGYNFIVTPVSGYTDSSGGTIVAFDFERLQAIDCAGLSTNPERLLTLEIDNYNNSDQSNGIIISVEYLVVAKVWKNGEIAINK